MSSNYSDIIYGACPMTIPSTTDVYGDLIGGYVVDENGYLQSNDKFYIRQYYIDDIMKDKSLCYVDYMVNINDVYALYID